MERLTDLDIAPQQNNKLSSLQNALRGALVSLLFLAGSAKADNSEKFEGIVEDRVDQITVNHVYDGKGKHIFDQTIFYEFCNQTQRLQVRAWRLIKHNSQVPLRDHTDNSWTTVWRDGCLLRKVKAPFFHESWTQHDPELVERDHLPRDRRQELYSPLLTYPSSRKDKVSP